MAGSTPHVPVRTCVGCGGKAPRAELLRLTVSGDGLVHVDPERRARGRGAHVHPRRECLEKAALPRAIGRAFRGKGRSPGEAVLIDEARVAAAGEVD